MDEREPWNVYENQQSRFTFNTVATCLGQAASPKPGQGGVVVMYDTPESVFQESQFGIAEYDTAGTLRAERIPQHQMVLSEPEIVQESESGPHVNDTSGTLRAGKDNFQAVVHDAPVEAFDEYNNCTDSKLHQSLLAGRTAQHTGVVHDAPFAAFDSTGGSQDMGKCDGTVAPTLKVGSSTGGGTRTIVRRLTPLECERLMGWPDNYTAYGITDDGEHVDIANTNRYRICGNGIVANVTEWIANRLPEAA